MSSSIVHYEGQELGLSQQWRPPKQVLEEARQAALALTEVISLKKNPVKFNNEIYLEFEDWQTCAKFYGVTAKVEKTEFVEFGPVRGFEASAVAIDRNGMEISRAEALCLDDEENWGKVPKYEWQDELDSDGKKIWVDGRDGKKRPKGKRVQVGEVAKPLFQLKSMAQTRACSKALRQVFAWVVVLAGYQPTPAEEMTGNEFPPEQQEKREPVKEPQSKSSQQTQQGGAVVGPVIYNGIIENAKQTATVLWLTVKGVGLVRVPQDKVDGDMVADNEIRFKGVKMNNEKIGDFLDLQGLVNLSKAAPEGTEAAARKAAEDMVEGTVNGKEAVQELVNNGSVKPASQVDAPKTIGMKRAQRIYILCGQNKAKNNGFNEEEAKKILAVLPVPLEHLRDLEIGLYEQFEKWATGENDYRDFWKDDEEVLPE